MSANRVAVLASGGADSSILLADLAASGREVTPIYVRFGLVWEAAELRWLQRFLSALSLSQVKPVREIDLSSVPFYGEDHWSVTGANPPAATSDDREVYLPGRNLILLTHAAAFAAAQGIGEIAVGSLKGNPFPDATEEFFDAFSTAATLGLARGIRVSAPYRTLSKEELIRRFWYLPLEYTFSCLSPVNGNHCGVCNKCAERFRAFESAGLADPTEYVRDRPPLRPLEL